MHLALADLVRAKWTDAIHDEWIRSVLRDRPDLTPQQLERTRALMNAHVRDCLVQDYEHLIPTLNLPDVDDCHVLAAAIRSGADVIVIYNLTDFPAESLAKYDLEVQHPDQFVLRLLELAPNAVCAALRRQRQNLKNPPRSAADLLATLERQELSQSARRLREFSQWI